MKNLLRISRVALPAVVALLLIAPIAQAEPEVVSDRWYTASLLGQPVGYGRLIERREGDRLVSVRQTKMTIRRGQFEVTMEQGGTEVETLDGQLIRTVGYEASGGTRIERELRVDGDKLHLTVRQGGNEREQTLERPEQAVLPAVAMRRELARRVAAGEKSFSLWSLEPSAGTEPVRVDVTVLGPEAVEVVGKVVPATKLSIRHSAAPGVKAVDYIDDQGHSVRSTITLMPGVELVLEQADRELAQAPVNPPELFERSLIKPTGELANPRQARRVVYQLTLDEAVEDANLPTPATTGSQRVEPVEGGWRVVVDLDAPPADEPVPGDAHRQPSGLIDSDHPAVQKLLTDALGSGRDGQTPAEKAAALEGFVRQHVRAKDLSVGFASASDVARTRQGDCTEHAVLLAALLRAADIPSRTVSGLVYVENFMGRSAVMGYHMWTQGYVDGRWVDFDAALPGYDAAHVALSVDPLADDRNDLLRLSGMMGRLSVRVVEVAQPAAAE